MKINESKVKRIINEEMMMLDDKHHMDHVDEEGGMAKSQLYNIAKYAMMLHDSLEDDTQLEAWVQSKITIASEYMSKVKHYLEYEMGIDMHDPEEDYDSESEIYDILPDSEPMMVVDSGDMFETKNNNSKLKETWPDLQD